MWILLYFISVFFTAPKSPHLTATKAVRSFFQTQTPTPIRWHFPAIPDTETIGNNRKIWIRSSPRLVRTPWITFTEGEIMVTIAEGIVLCRFRMIRWTISFLPYTLLAISPPKMGNDNQLEVQNSPWLYVRSPTAINSSLPPLYH